jgi:membrane protein
MVVLLFAALYYVTAPRRSAGFHWVTAGSLLAVTIWMAGSAGLALYVSNFGSYDKTYGTLGGLVCLLVWLWITNVALLLGMELNSERERSRELADGVPGADRELQLDARSAPKRQKTT